MSSAKLGVLLKSDSIASIYRNEIVESLKRLSSKEEEEQSSGSLSIVDRPRLCGILSTASAPSKFYAEFTRKHCEELGIEFILKVCGSAVAVENGNGNGGDGPLADGEGVEEAIIEANEDDSIHGIMVYYPIFGGQQDHYLQQIVSPIKDVEGLNFKYAYNLYHNIRFVKPESLLSPSVVTTTTSSSASSSVSQKDTEIPPEGTVKSILPCTPLAVVKCLEYVRIYNALLHYGDRAYGKTITVINRSEVVGRPLAALLANDGARVFSVDIDSIQEYTKRPKGPEGTAGDGKEEQKQLKNRYHPRHVVHPCKLTLEECLGLSDAVVSAVPTPQYKVKTAWLKDGCVCVNVAAEKNFEQDVREKASIYLPTIGKVTNMMLLRNLLRLKEYRKML